MTFMAIKLHMCLVVVASLAATAMHISLVVVTHLDGLATIYCELRRPRGHCMPLSLSEQQTYG